MHGVESMHANQLATSTDKLTSGRAGCHAVRTDMAHACTLCSLMYVCRALSRVFVCSLSPTYVLMAVLKLFYVVGQIRYDCCCRTEATYEYSHLRCCQEDDNAKYFKTNLCHQFQDTGTCVRGDNCHYAHGEAELRRPNRVCAAACRFHHLSYQASP